MYDKGSLLAILHDALPRLLLTQNKAEFTCLYRAELTKMIGAPKTLLTPALIKLRSLMTYAHSYVHCETPFAAQDFRRMQTETDKAICALESQGEVHAVVVSWMKCYIHMSGLQYAAILEDEFLERDCFHLLQSDLLKHQHQCVKLLMDHQQELLPALQQIVHSGASFNSLISPESVGVTLTPQAEHMDRLISQCLNAMIGRTSEQLSDAEQQLFARYRALRHCQETITGLPNTVEIKLVDHSTLFDGMQEQYNSLCERKFILQLHLLYNHTNETPVYINERAFQTQRIEPLQQQYLANHSYFDCIATDQLIHSISDPLNTVTYVSSLAELFYLATRSADEKCELEEDFDEFFTFLRGDNADQKQFSMPNVLATDPARQILFLESCAQYIVHRFRLNVQKEIETSVDQVELILARVEQLLEKIEDQFSILCSFFSELAHAKILCYLRLLLEIACIGNPKSYEEQGYFQQEQFQSSLSAWMQEKIEHYTAILNDSSELNTQIIAYRMLAQLLMSNDSDTFESQFINTFTNGMMIDDFDYSFNSRLHFLTCLTEYVSGNLGKTYIDNPQHAKYVLSLIASLSEPEDEAVMMRPYPKGTFYAESPYDFPLLKEYVGRLFSCLKTTELTEFLEQTEQFKRYIERYISELNSQVEYAPGNVRTDRDALLGFSEALYCVVDYLNLAKGNKIDSVPLFREKITITRKHLQYILCEKLGDHPIDKYITSRLSLWDKLISVCFDTHPDTDSLLQADKLLGFFNYFTRLRREADCEDVKEMPVLAQLAANSLLNAQTIVTRKKVSNQFDEETFSIMTMYMEQITRLLQVNDDNETHAYCLMLMYAITGESKTKLAWLELRKANQAEALWSTFDDDPLVWAQRALDNFCSVQIHFPYVNFAYNTFQHLEAIWRADYTAIKAKVDEQNMQYLNRSSQAMMFVRQALFFGSTQGVQNPIIPLLKVLAATSTLLTYILSNVADSEFMRQSQDESLHGVTTVLSVLVNAIKSMHEQGAYVDEIITDEASCRHVLMLISNTLLNCSNLILHLNYQPLFKGGADRQAIILRSKYHTKLMEEISTSFYSIICNQQTRTFIQEQFQVNYAFFFGNNLTKEAVTTLFQLSKGDVEDGCFTTAVNLLCASFKKVFNTIIQQPFEHALIKDKVKPLCSSLLKKRFSASDVDACLMFVETNLGQDPCSLVLLQNLLAAYHHAIFTHAHQQKKQIEWANRLSRIIVLALEHAHVPIQMPTISMQDQFSLFKNGGDKGKQRRVHTKRRKAIKKAEKTKALTLSPQTICQHAFEQYRNAKGLANKLAALGELQQLLQQHGIKTNGKVNMAQHCQILVAVQQPSHLLDHFMQSFVKAESCEAFSRWYDFDTFHLLDTQPADDIMYNMRVMTSWCLAKCHNLLHKASKLKYANAFLLAGFYFVPLFNSQLDSEHDVIDCLAQHSELTFDRHDPKTLEMLRYVCKFIVVSQQRFWQHRSEVRPLGLLKAMRFLFNDYLNTVCSPYRVLPLIATLRKTIGSVREEFEAEFAELALDASPWDLEEATCTTGPTG